MASAAPLLSAEEQALDDRIWWEGSNVLDYKAQRVQIVQVGLGDNGTVIQNLAGWWEEWSRCVAWIMAALTRNDRDLTAVSVEPVRGLVQRCTESVRVYLPGMSLVEVAIGEWDTVNTIHSFDETKFQALVEETDSWRQEDLRYEACFLRNMSSVGQPHVALDWHSWKLNVDLSQCYVPKPVEVWSYGRLARTLNFVGCEALYVDAEGFDSEILRSMVFHCRYEEAQFGRDAWPWIICYESMGHCDLKDGKGTERRLKRLLKRNGYQCVYTSLNTVMVLKRAVLEQPHIAAWVARFHKCPRRRPRSTST